MFDKFTETARNVVMLGQKEARSFNHNYIGPEHLLLGLLREDKGVAARTLRSLNVDLKGAREQVENVVGYGKEKTVVQAPFSPSSKKVLESSLREALNLEHKYIGTEHILLGLAREREGVAAQVLSNLGVAPDEVRREVIRMLVSSSSRKLGVSSAEKFYRAQVTGVEVEANFGASWEQRKAARALILELNYEYEARGAESLSWIDHEYLIEHVVVSLKERGFQLVETGVKRVGESILREFPNISEVIVRITIPETSGVSVSATFRR